MRFKEPLLAYQYQNEIHKRLHGIILALAGFSWNSFKKEITVTSLIRLDNPKSVHYYGRGADIRSKCFTHQEKIEILYYLNTSFTYNKGDLKTCLLEYKDEENEHFHIQVKA
jgi:hypothetical protein